MNSSEISKSIQKISEWLSELGYSVKRNRGLENQIIFEDKVIEINSSLSLEKQLYVLLHECGHLVIFHEANGAYAKKYPLGLKMMTDGRVARSIRGKVESLEEEIQAWRVGENVANILQIPIDIEKYKKISAKFIMTYVDFYSTKRRDKKKIIAMKTEQKG